MAVLVIWCTLVDTIFVNCICHSIFPSFRNTMWLCGCGHQEDEVKDFNKSFPVVLWLLWICVLQLGMFIRFYPLLQLCCFQDCQAKNYLVWHCQLIAKKEGLGTSAFRTCIAGMWTWVVCTYIWESGKCKMTVVICIGCRKTTNRLLLTSMCLVSCTALRVKFQTALRTLLAIVDWGGIGFEWKKRACKWMRCFRDLEDFCRLYESYMCLLSPDLSSLNKRSLTPV